LGPELAPVLFDSTGTQDRIIPIALLVQVQIVQQSRCSSRPRHDKKAPVAVALEEIARDEHFEARRSRVRDGVRLPHALRELVR